MKYKTITYNCNCKYIFITDPEKRIFKDHKFCPNHGKLKKHVMLWCKDCDLEIIETGPMSWQRKKRCFKCAKLNQKKKTLSLKLLYRKMSIGLPVVETPILNNYITKKRRDI